MSWIVISAKRKRRLAAVRALSSLMQPLSRFRPDELSYADDWAVETEEED